MTKHIRNFFLAAAATVLFGVPYLQAADVAISALPAGTTLAGTEAIPAVQSAATVKTTPAAIKTYVETGGTVTASDPVLDLTQTWNNAAVTFDALVVNVTKTAAGTDSRGLNVNVGGRYLYYVPDTIGGNDYLSLNNSRITNQNGYGFQFTSTAGTGSAYAGYYGLVSHSTGVIGFSSGAANNSADVALYRDAAGTLALRRGTNAQTFRVYSTYTDASNYERLSLRPGAASAWMQVAAETAGTGADNISLALSPVGASALSAHVPDSAAAGGNARGTYSTDWQRARSVNTEVASATYSTIGGGNRNTASGGYSAVAGGSQNTASGGYAAMPGGYNNTASGDYSVAAGVSSTASGLVSTAIGSTAVASGAGSVSLGVEGEASGNYSVALGNQSTTRGLTGAVAYSSGRRSATGDAQVISQQVRRTTTDATPVSLATNGTPAATTVMVIPDGAVMMCTATVAAKPSASITDGVGFVVEASFYRSGSTTALLSTPVSTAHGTNALALNATLVANNTIESAEIEVTGAAATTIYWVGELKCVQVL